MAPCVAIALVELLRGCGEVDVGNALLLRQLLHVVGIVHGVVVGRHALVGQYAVGRKHRELVAEIVAAVAANGTVAVEIAAAHRTDEYGMGALCLDFFDDFPQPRLIGCGRHGAAAVKAGGLACHALRDVVVVDLVAIHAVDLLIVVGKLDKHVVAGLHIVLGVLPKLIVAAARVAPAAGIVDGCPSAGEEIAKVHSPTAGHGGTFFVGCHRRVADGVHLLRVGDEAHTGEHCHK